MAKKQTTAATTTLVTGNYYANTALAAYNDRVANHEAVLATYEQGMADYQRLHDEWVAAGSPDAAILPEPVPPPEVTAPAPELPPAYTVREVSEPELLATEHGDALVLPPRLVLSGVGGETFALSAEELALTYTAAAAVKA